MSTIVPSKLLVCAECLTALVAMGATRVEGERVGSLLDRCAAHTPARAEVHAMHEVLAVPELVDAWRLVCEGAMPPPPSTEDAELIARLAAQLLTGKPEAVRVEVEQAVCTARAILATAKGCDL